MIEQTLTKFEVSLHIALSINHIVRKLLELEIPASVFFALLFFLLFDSSFVKATHLFISLIIEASLVHLRLLLLDTIVAHLFVLAYFKPLICIKLIFFTILAWILRSCPIFIISVLLLILLVLFLLSKVLIQHAIILLAKLFHPTHLLLLL